MKIKDLPQLWKKENSIVCIASGPSLTKEDCDFVKQKGLKTIVTNSTYQLVKDPDIVYGFDLKWWDFYYNDVVRRCDNSLLLTQSMNSGKFDKLQTLYGAEWFTHFGNSGTAIISLAIEMGVKNIILLGYDCSMLNDKAHWHDNHPDGFSNCKSIAKWPAQFMAVSNYAKLRGVNVLNCTRSTILECFERKELNSAF